MKVTFWRRVDKGDLSDTTFRLYPSLRIPTFSRILESNIHGGTPCFYST